MKVKDIVQMVDEEIKVSVIAYEKEKYNFFVYVGKAKNLKLGVIPFINSINELEIKEIDPYKEEIELTIK